MSHITQIRARTVATLGVMAALVVGGVAAAQSDSGGGAPDQTEKAGKRPPPGLPPGGPPMMKGLTYGELHVRTKDGAAETIRLDQGKVVTVDADSITLTENDGNEVTVALDEDTDVLARPGTDSGADDLEAGQQVLVTGPEGEAAKSVVVIPSRAEMKKGMNGELPPPPPGAPAPGAGMGS